MMRRILRGLAVALFSAVFLAGCVCIAWPFAATKVQEIQTEQVIEQFQECWGSDEEGENDPPYQELRSAMEDYNQEIYEEGQSGLCDAWSYRVPSFDLSSYGLDTDILGYIEIPAMDSTLPIYLGASTENMRKGAVHLSQTSLPIGGENTNCVLAAHRGYQGIPFWRDIEQLSVGDEIFVTNLWEKLTYQVTEIQVIYPNESDKILIQEGKDMLTLITCHPYGGHGTYRYVVYCERVDSAGETLDIVDNSVEYVDILDIPWTSSDANQPNLTISPGIPALSSQAQINTERLIQTAGGAFLLLSLVWVICYPFLHYRKVKSNHRKGGDSHIRNHPGDSP